MPQYQAGQVKLQSGNSQSTTSMQVVQGVTSININPTIPRANVMVLNRGKPLEDRPVINYSPVDASFDYIWRNAMVEQTLGLVNPTGFAAQLTETKAGLSTFAVRNMQVYYAPTSSANYNGLYDLKSGVLTSYGLQGSINEPVRGSVSFRFLDMSGSINTTARDSASYAASLVKPEGTTLTGIQFTGYGLTGVIIQSFSLSVGVTRAEVYELTNKFPTQRPLTDVQATLQVQGFFEGLNNSMTGLTQFDCGGPSVGIVGITLTPSCSAGSAPTTITMKNPYIDGWSVEGQVGNFSTVSLSLSMPLGPNPLETTDGSVLTIT